MSNETKELSEREEIESMLPWFERGQLDDADMRRVEDYLATHPDVADQLALVEEERGEAVLLNEARGVPSPGALDRLMNSIEAHEAANPSLASTRKAVWGWASRLVGAPVPASLQWVAAAAAVLIVVQGVSLGVLMTSGVPQGPGYETASGPSQQVETGTFFLVQFTEGAQAGDINKILTEKGYSIVDGPKPDGMYKVRVSSERLEDSKRDTILNELLSESGLVAFAAPTE